MTRSNDYPRGFRPVALVVVISGLLLSVIQRWLMWRALEGASPMRQRAVLFTWHLRMLQSSYYPAAGQRYVPWIQGLAIGGIALLLVVAGILMLWARRSTTTSSVRAS